MFSIFLIALVAIAIGIALAIFATRSQAPGAGPLIPPEEDFDRDPKDKAPLTLGDLFRLGEHLCGKNHLRVKDRLPQSEDEVYWIAESNNEFFSGNYVLGFIQTGSLRPFVTMHDVLEFKDFLKSVGSTKGLLFTSGYFTRDVHQPLEGPAVALYNRRRVLEELKDLT